MVALALVLLVAGCGAPAARPPGLPIEPDRRGDEYFAWSRQSRGGDYNVDTALVSYVRQTGEKLVIAAGLRPADFHFAIVNHSAANAWATPAANIALSRGLLLSLENEAELAAVLAHEIAHAQLRHFRHHEIDAVPGVLGTDHGVALELAADARSVEIMAHAGYRPRAALDSLLRLQQPLPAGPGESAALSQHQLSLERLSALRLQASQAGRAGRLHADDFQRRLHTLRADAGAYQDYDMALALLQAGKLEAAHTALQRALARQPGEYLFHVLEGEYRAAKGDRAAAIVAWDRAIALQPAYYHPWLLRGWSALQAGDAGAGADLRASHHLLPTDQSAYALGKLALADGEKNSATEYFRAAAGGESPWSAQAGIALARLELADAPARYVTATVSSAAGEGVHIEITNRAPIAVTGLELELRYFSRERWRELLRVAVPARLEPGERHVVTPAAAVPREQIDRMAVHLAKAQPADN